MKEIVEIEQSMHRLASSTPGIKRWLADLIGMDGILPCEMEKIRGFSEMLMPESPWCLRQARCSLDGFDLCFE